MRQEGQGLTPQEQLRADNDYMKMKLMLERGAKFGSSGQENDLPPEIENRFLRNVMEFESLNDKRAFIKVSEKLGSPEQFIPEEHIDDSRIDHAWTELLAFLNRHQITIGVCSPNVKPRDLYRFVTQELFDLHISSVDMPGLVHGFIYDEFHPDPAFDNPRSVIEGFLEPLFSSRPFEAMHFYRRFDLRLNDHYPLSQRQFMNLVNHFRNNYEGFSRLQLSQVCCSIDGSVSDVSGKFRVEAARKEDITLLEGAWTISLSENPLSGVWEINSARIGGISF